MRAAGALLLAVLLLAVLPAQADTTWYRLDFEGARLQQNAVIEEGRAYRLRREGGAVGAGRLVRDGQSGSTVLELTSRATPRGTRADRAEIQVYSGIAWDRMWYLGFDVLMPRGTAFSDTWHLLMQCHQNGTRLSPPLSLDLEPDGRLALVARGDRDSYASLWSAPMPRGRWVRVVLGFRMGEAGQARLWLDGRRVLDARLPLGWKQGEPACTLKTGLYRGPATTPFAIRLDNIALGSSLRAVRRN